MAEEPEKSFLADMNGLFAQHAAMWSVYTESIKLLVSITSLPILAAAVLLSMSKDGNAASSIDFANLPAVLYWTLFILPVLGLLLLGVVIQHRLVILFYARGLNGYRSIYLEWWNNDRRARSLSDIVLPMPTDASYPSNLEVAGPMGLIVHCSGLVNGLYLFGATFTLRHSLLESFLSAAAVLIVYEIWYAAHCKRALWQRTAASAVPETQRPQ